MFYFFLKKKFCLLTGLKLTLSKVKSFLPDNLSGLNFFRSELWSHFSGFCLVFWVSSVSPSIKWIYKIYCLYKIYFIFHSLWSFNGISVAYLEGPYYDMNVMWLVWFISAFHLLFNLKGWGVPTLFRRFLQICSHLLKKSLMENFSFCISKWTTQQ